MKNYLMCALLMCAIPLAAFGQADGVGVTCADCTHEVSVYMGDGGLIATAADDAELVTWVATCGGVTTSGELEPNADGVVDELFTMDNGLACHHEDGGSFRIGPIMDGGWYWITDASNSAVGNLVSNDILDNDATMITDAGDSITVMEGRGAVYLKHEETGRVGILPTILPVPPPPAPEAPDVCGPSATGTFQQNSCMLGDGGTMIVLHGPTTTGMLSEIDNGMVYRRTSGDVELTYALYGNGTGHIATPPLIGWYRKDGKPFEATYDVMVEAPARLSIEDAGVSFTNDTTTTVDRDVDVPMTDDDEIDLAELGTTGRVGDSDSDGDADCVVYTALDQADPPAVTHYHFMASENELGQRYVAVEASAITGIADTVSLTNEATSTWVTGYNASVSGTPTVKVHEQLNADRSAVLHVPQVRCKTIPVDMDVSGGIVISPSPSLCTASNSEPVELSITASGAAAMNAAVTPPIMQQKSDGVNATTSLTVMCPAVGASSSANQGVELVPGNPFPSTSE